jgi:DNA polymerase-3 subunit gamma/tau
MSDEPSLGFDPAPAKPASTQPYRVLARKYRPSDFSGLVGQDALVKTLSNAFATGRIAHAFMLTGVRGVGKTTTARIIARALNCIGPDGTRKAPTIHPCGQCEPCIAIAESRHVDVQEMDAASNNGVDEVRQIIDSVRYAPASARYKVYILDEVHMLSKPAFNAILKTLEEPPPHVKFIFATTEIRKVPVTILSRCQRFDLRRIETEELVGLLSAIADKEGVKIARDALALIARAAEGSARDSLSLLDQAIAHGEDGGEISAEAVRDMLGLADRGRVLDLFEKLMGGKVADALADLNSLYDHGADPLAVMQDLLEIVHFLTRVKVAPGAEGFFDGGSGEAKRAAAMAGKLSVPSLTRAWQVLLKGLIEVRDATRPVAACEMALIRLAYAADLPPTDKLVRDLLDNPPAQRTAPATASGESRGEGAPPRASMSAAPSAQVQRAPAPRTEPTMSAAPQIELRTLTDIIAKLEGVSKLKVDLEHNVHLVRMEPGRLEIRPTSRAPATLAGDLSQKLFALTGTRWTVSISREDGAPTLAEQKRNAKAVDHERAAQEPLVRAVLDRFPGAEILKVHKIADEDIAVAMPEDDS